MRRLIAVVMVTLMAAIAAINIYLFPWLNGQGFVKSHNGYWVLSPRESDDFTFILESHANRRTESLEFYIRLGQYARGRSVTAPPGTLDTFRLQSLTRTRPVITDNYDPTLPLAVLNNLQDAPSVQGRFYKGPVYEIFIPNSLDLDSYRIMTSEGLVVAIPDSLFKSSPLTGTVPHG